MSIKLYAKNGKRNYKENKLLKELQPIIDERMKGNPELAESFRPATNFEELQAMHRMYASQQVDYTEVNNINSMAKDKDEEIEINDDNDFFKQIEEGDDGGDFIDPFNREAPIVRDYVTEGGLRESNEPEGPIRTHFDEPVTFQDAFELPSDDENDNPEVRGKDNQQKQREPKREKPSRPEPLNPSFDDMSSGKKKRSTKKFAKYIVETVCMLAERGFIWYVTKDINDTKLTEYELNGEMDLSLLVNLDNGQEATVKQFFNVQCDQAEQYAKFDKEEKEDLADALAEVLLEKGVGPTPMQEMWLIAGNVVGEKVIMMLTMKSQQNGLLAQLRAMNEGRQQQRYQEPYYEPAPTAQPTSVTEQEPIATQEEMPIFDLSNESDLEIDQVIETKE